MRGLLFVLVVAMGQPLYADTTGGTKPKPIGSPRNWIPESEYPSAALGLQQDRTVAFSLTVDATGKVTGCQVRQPSGREDLDAITCTILTRRAKFRPMSATGAGPSVGVYHSRVRWLAPEPPTSVTGAIAARTIAEDDSMDRNH